MYECLSLKEWARLLEENDLSVIRSDIEKKQYDFPVWVKRTTENQAQINSVNDYIHNADQEIKTYFQVEEANGEIMKLSVDQGMMMCKKLQSKRDV